MSGERVVTRAEAAHILRVSLGEVARLADSGVLPFVRIPSGHRRFRREDVIACRDAPAVPRRRAYQDLVGQRLQAARHARGLSLADVEEKSGGVFRAAAVGTYERGDRHVTVARLARLAKFYGVRPASLLPDDDGPELSFDSLLAVLKAAEILAGASADVKAFLMTGGENGRVPS